MVAVTNAVDEVEEGDVLVEEETAAAWSKSVAPGLFGMSTGDKKEGRLACPFGLRDTRRPHWLLRPLLRQLWLRWPLSRPPSHR